MSIRTMTRVWDHAEAEGGALLALLALADFADDEGYCWPKVSEVARKARLSERGTYDVLASLEAAGEIARFAGGGRGRAATYVVLTGFSADERAKRVQGLQGKSEQRMQKMQGLRAKRVQPSQGLQRKTLNAAQKNPANGRTGAAPDTGVLTPKNEAGATLIRHVDPSDPDSTTPLPPEQPAAVVVVVEAPAASDFPERPAGQPDSRTTEPDQPSPPPPPVAGRPLPPATRTPSRAPVEIDTSPGARLLAAEGFRITGIREFGHFPPEVLAPDIARMRAEGTEPGGMVLHWRQFPPGTTPAKTVTEASNGANQPDRLPAGIIPPGGRRPEPAPRRETYANRRERLAREADAPAAAPDAQ